MEGMFDKCLFVLRNLSSLLERLCALQSRVFDRFFEAAEIAKFTSREFGEHWENLKSFRDWYSVMSTQLKKGREEDLKEDSKQVFRKDLKQVVRKNAKNETGRYCI